MSLFIKKYKYPNGKVYYSIVDGFRINGKIKLIYAQKIWYSRKYKKILKY